MYKYAKGDVYMANERIFYRCSVCGNIIGMIEDGGVTPECCGLPMDQLAANTSDGAQEKHVPALTRNGSELTVFVGSTPHPMTEEHHIAWIAVAQGRRTQREELLHTCEPRAAFHVNDGPLTVYEYCNIHGLWKAEG